MLQPDKLEGMDKDLDQQIENNRRDWENGIPLGRRLRQKVNALQGLQSRMARNDEKILEIQKEIIANNLQLENHLAKGKLLHEKVAMVLEPRGILAAEVAGVEPARPGTGGTSDKPEESQPQIDILWGNLKDRLVQDENPGAVQIRQLLEQLGEFPPTQPDQPPPQGKSKLMGPGPGKDRPQGLPGPTLTPPPQV